VHHTGLRIYCGPTDVDELREKHKWDWIGADDAEFSGHRDSSRPAGSRFILPGRVTSNVNLWGSFSEITKALNTPSWSARAVERGSEQRTVGSVRHIRVLLESTDASEAGLENGDYAAQNQGNEPASLHYCGVQEQVAFRKATTQFPGQRNPRRGKNRDRVF